MQVYAPTTSYCEEDINSVYNDIDETLGKPNQYTVAMGDFYAEIGKRTNPMETATGKFGLELRNERGDTLVEWVTPRKDKIMNTTSRCRIRRKSPNGVPKTEIECMLRNKTDIDLTRFNQI